MLVLMTAEAIKAAGLPEMLTRRSAIDAEIKNLEAGGDLTAETETRMDALIGEFETLNAEIKARESAATRASKLAGVRAGTSAGTGFQPLATGNVAELGQRQLDPVDHPDPARYSVLRAISQLAAKKPVTGYEAELSQEIEKRNGGREPQGFFMPTALRVDPRVERRDLTMSAASGALQTGTASTVIGMLRNQTQIIQLGATLMSGMVGDFDLPRQTGGGTAYWVTEGTAITESAQAIGQVAFSPSTVGAFTDYTRKLVKQTSIDAEAFVRGDLTRVLAIELDRAAINGSGSGAEPEGILQNSSITSVAIGTNGGALTWAKVVELEETVGVANADVATMAYLTNAKTRGHGKRTVKVSGYPTYLVEDNESNGYPVAVSNNVPSNLTKGSGTALSAMIFGDFSTVYIASWGGVDVNVDPYSLSTAGSVRVVVLLDTDIQFRHTASLAKIVDIVTT